MVLIGNLINLVRPISDTWTYIRSGIFSDTLFICLIIYLDRYTSQGICQSYLIYVSTMSRTVCLASYITSLIFFFAWVSKVDLVMPKMS